MFRSDRVLLIINPATSTRCPTSRILTLVATVDPIALRGYTLGTLQSSDRLQTDVLCSHRRSLCVGAHSVLPVALRCMTHKYGQTSVNLESTLALSPQLCIFDCAQLALHVCLHVVFSPLIPHCDHSDNQLASVKRSTTNRCPLRQAGTLSLHC